MTTRDKGVGINRYLVSTIAKREVFIPSGTKAENIGKILHMQQWLGTIPQTDYPLKHHFAPGLYGREIFIPAGDCVAGKMHRHSHLNTISKGHVLVMTENGLLEFKAPITFTSPAFVKRVVYAHEDTIWTTYHVTDKIDLAEIEAEIIMPETEIVRRMQMLAIEGAES